MRKPHRDKLSSPGSHMQLAGHDLGIGTQASGASGSYFPYEASALEALS